MKNNKLTNQNSGKKKRILQNKFLMYMKSDREMLKELANRLGRSQTDTVCILVREALTIIKEQKKKKIKKEITT